jgi:seryl-tRNA synthetase
VTVLDLKFLRQNPEIVVKAIKNKNESVDFDDFLKLDTKRRALIQKIEEGKQRRNILSKEIATKRTEGEDAGELMVSTRDLSTEIKELEKELKSFEDKIHEILVRIPNIPHSSVPTGEDTNSVVREGGEKREFDFKPLPHWELGSALDILDFPSAAKVCGSNFPSYKGVGARLERALINFMLDFSSRRGYTEIFPPFLANRSSMFATGQLPKLENDMYLIEEDDLFLIPTAEVPVTNIHREQILRPDELPIQYAAYTACFRREAGSYGADTKGLLRVHQFNKVELVKFTTPESSYDELERMLDDACAVLEALGIPYRVSLLCTGELSFASAKTYDVEAWAPGVQRYLEVSSVSNFEDFQARRAEIRFRRAAGEKAEFVHTLNGSAVATPRTFAAIIENYQRKDGTVEVPQVLVPYIGVAQLG